MNSPAAALAWEMWRRHQKRLLALGFLLAAFALFYPAVCARLGLNLDAPNALDELATTFSHRAGLPRPSQLYQIMSVLGILFVLLGPVTCMAISLFCVIWIFTLVQLDPKRGFSFPARLFTLPLSTRFLAAWLMGVGTATVVAVYLGWTRLVHLPHINVFDGFSNGLVWVTLLVVSQAVLWGLDAFPVARALIMTAVGWGLAFLAGPGLENHPLLERNQPMVLWVLLSVGCGAAYTGLGKIRQGAWQGWIWNWQSVFPAGVASHRTSGVFRSPARAQFWFEWRRQGRKLLFCVCALGGLPVLSLVIFKVIARLGPLSPHTTFGLGLYLLAVPLFIHFFQGVAPERDLPPFQATRPLSDGEIVRARLEAAALSTALSWAATLLLLAVVPFLGDVPSAIDQVPWLSRNLSSIQPMLPVILVALIFLTWRFIAADLWFGLCGQKQVAAVPGVKIYALLALYALLSYLMTDAGFERTLFQILPFALAGLLVCKLILARWAFRVSLQRQLLTRAALLQYLCFWSIFAVAFVVPAVLRFHRERWITSLVLGILLLLPLARIAFSPIALSLSRHR